MPDLSIEVEWIRDPPAAAWVTLVGAGDTKTVPGFQGCLNQLLRAGITRFAFDVERLLSMGGTFDRCLIDFASARDRGGGMVVLVRPHPKLKIVGDTLGWWKILRLAQSRAEALGLLRASARPGAPPPVAPPGPAPAPPPPAS